MKSGIQIQKLDSSDKESILKIADWYFDEWNTPIDKTVNRLANQPGKDTLFQLILTIENELIATGGLCNTVNIYKVYEKLKKYNPWVGLLYTQKDYRNKGFATILLNRIEQHAKEIKLKKIYLYTFTAESLYKQCGWSEIDRVIYKGQETAVMEKVL